MTIADIDAPPEAPKLTLGDVAGAPKKLTLGDIAPRKTMPLGLVAGDSQPPAVPYSDPNNRVVDTFQPSEQRGLMQTTTLGHMASGLYENVKNAGNIVGQGIKRIGATLAEEASRNPGPGGDFDPTFHAPTKEELSNPAFAADLRQTRDAAHQSEQESVKAIEETGNRTAAPVASNIAPFAAAPVAGAVGGPLAAAGVGAAWLQADVYDNVDRELRSRGMDPGESANHAGTAATLVTPLAAGIQAIPGGRGAVTKAAAEFAKNYATSAVTQIASNAQTGNAHDSKQDLIAGMIGLGVHGIHEVARGYLGGEANKAAPEVAQSPEPHRVDTSATIEPAQSSSGSHPSSTEEQSPQTQDTGQFQQPIQRGNTQPSQPPKTVRVYRGEGSEKVALPDWALQNAGEWFSTDSRKAEQFRDLRGGKIRTLDIPEELLAQLKAPEGNAPDEYLIPRHFQDKYASLIPAAVAASEPVGSGVPNVLDQNKTPVQQASATESTPVQSGAGVQAPTPKAALPLESHTGKSESLQPSQPPENSIDAKPGARQPLSNFGDTMHSENGPDKAIRILHPKGGGLGFNDEVWMSNNPDMATGQAGNKGVKIEFDAKGLTGIESQSKPGAEFQAKQGNREIRGADRAEAYQNAARKVTVDPSVMTPIEQQRAGKLERYLESKGWTKTENADGTRTYEKTNAGGVQPPEIPGSVQKEVPPTQPEANREPNLTSARKEWTAKDREDLGVNELPSPERHSWESALGEAKSKGIPDRAMDLAAEVQAKPRSLSDTETAGMVVHAARLKNQHTEAMDAVGKSTDPAEIKLRSAEALRVEQDFDQLTEALRTSGTEKGRALASQKLTINKDYKLVSVLNRAKAAKGEALTPGERGQVETLTKQLAASDAKVTELQNKINEYSAEQSIKRAKIARTPVDIVAKTARLKELLKAGCA